MSIAHLNAGAVLQQDAHHPIEIERAGRAHGQMQRRVAERVLRIRFGTELQQLYDDVGVAAAGAQMQSAALILVAAVRIDAGLEQPQQHLDVGQRRGQPQFALVGQIANVRHDLIVAQMLMRPNATGTGTGRGRAAFGCVWGCSSNACAAQAVR